MLDAIEGCTSSLRIISPFAKVAALREVLECGTLPRAKRQLITRAEDRAAANGVLDYQGLREWVEGGARLRVADRSLHAKVLLFDERAALVTSANLTDSGFGGNRELGIFTTEQSTVLEVSQFFDDLWAGLGQDVTASEIAAWQMKLAQALEGWRPVIPSGLRDRGKRAATSNGKARVEPADTGRRYFLKSYKNDNNTPSPDFQPAASAAQWGGVTFPLVGPSRPTRFRSGDIVFLCWTLKDGRKRVGVRGEVERAWDEAVDVAPAALRSKSEAVEHWPAVVWLANVEVLRGPIEHGLDVDRVLDDLREQTFVASAKYGPEGGEKAARAIFSASRSHPELTSTAGLECDARFRALAEAQGTVVIPSGQHTWWDNHGPGEYRKAYWRRRGGMAH